MARGAQGGTARRADSGDRPAYQAERGWRQKVMNDTAVVCARLLREGAVLRSELPELDYPEVRAEVERRLEKVGVVLAASVYSEYVGLRLVPEVTADLAFDAASNLGLNADHCALLVVLWSYLSLQKRTASESREVPGQNVLFAPRSRGSREKIRSKRAY